MINIIDINNKLVNYQQENDSTLIFNSKLITSTDNADIIQIIRKDYEEFPIYLSLADKELLCIVYLFNKDDLQPNNISQLHEDMLRFNITLPLSSFSMLGNEYILFGSLSSSSSINEIIEELETLSDNTIEALNALKDYFI